jgi:hypothetical protein
MNTSKNVDFIERYVAAVGRELPANLRDDIENELRSSLLDMLEDRLQQGSNLSEEQVVLEMLQSMAPPKLMARRYTGSRSLIGPEIYPAFVVTTRITLIVLAVVYLTGVLMGLATLPGGQLVDQIGDSLVGLMVSALSSFGGLVLLFVLLERFAMGGQGASVETWKPQALLAVKVPDLVRPFSALSKIVFALALIVLIDFFPQWVGVSYYRAGQWYHIPALTERFSTFVWPIHILVVAVVLFNLALLRWGSWDQRSKWIQFGISLFQLVLILAMIRGPAVLALEATGITLIGRIDVNGDLLLWLWLVVAGLRFGRWIAENELYASIPVQRWQRTR